MSAVTSNSSDRELEALHRAQRAYEPSMEEILASIRTIIADERDSGARRPATPSPSPQIVYSKDAPAPQRDREPAEAEASQTAEPQHPLQAVSRQPEPASPESAEDTEPDANGPLLSPETDEAVTSAFAALSAQLAARSAELADGMIRDMLRPMLKAWLDENLPGIVERLVGAEIERLASRTR
jgi:cell pole-organizing protein PopZ